MNFDLSDEQRMLAEQARGLLKDRSTHDRLRALIDEGAEWDEPLWHELAAMGFLGASIPEAYGGLGLSELDLAVISEEIGRANAAIPFLSSIVLAADAIRHAGSEAQKSHWLPKLASGEVVATFAYAEGAAGWSADVVQASVEAGKLTGRKTPVADAGIASIAVVLVRHEGVIRLGLVQLDASGVSRTKLTSFDQLRAHYRIDFDQAPVELLGEGDARDIVAHLFDRAAVQVAFESVGGAEACLYMARDYALERRIFGRSLASYQAIKHKLADLAVQVELARSNAYFAAWAADEDAQALPGAAAAARLSAIAAFEMGARENLQVHGGIGYTFEANCHFYYRRERLQAVVLGDRLFWARRLVASRSETQAEVV